MLSPAVHDMKQIEIQERMSRVLELRSERKTWRDIGSIVGVSHVQAYYDYKKALELAKEERRRNTDMYLDDQIAVLNRLLETHIPPAIGGSIESTSIVLKLMDQQARLLNLYPTAQGDKDNGVSVTINYNGLHVDMRQQSVSVQSPTLPDSGAAMLHAGDSSVNDDYAVPVGDVFDDIEDAETIAAPPPRGTVENVDT